MNWRDLTVVVLGIAVAVAVWSWRGRAESAAQPSRRLESGGLRLDIPAQDVELISQQGPRAVLKVDMREHPGLDVEIQFQGPSRDWSFNLGDSSSNNGYGGDGGSTSHDAEMQIVNGRLDVFASDQIVDGDKHLVKGWPIQGESFKFQISDGRLSGDNGLSLQNTALFALKGQEDREGPVNYDLFVGVNRVIGGGRVGSGVSGLKLRFSQ
ncbi:hypothetical protein IV102_28030 [bacterium]|nr:hypothetical protein [bacterium]